MNEHIPVLLTETINKLNINPSGTYIDMTLGGGGHAEAILKKLTDGELIGFDQDEFAIQQATAKLAKYPNFFAIRDNFINAKERLADINIFKVDGIIFDLGVSSFQFDLPERGFSYRYNNELDMRMNQNQTLSAKEIVNNFSYDELVKIFFNYGEEKYSRLIAKNIIIKREEKPIETTFDLVDIIKDALPKKVLYKKGHPAKKVFQALRIAVNNELNILEVALKKAIDLLKPKARLAVITFHSLEDRICKNVFKKLATIDIPKGLPIIPDEDPIITLVNKKVIIASENELKINNRAHSAKLRVIEKN